jgi:putative sterol carrier protein
VLAGKKNIAGDPDVAVLDVAMKAVINEYTKIISGSMGNAAMAEGEIKKVTDLLNSAQTPKQVQDVLAFMKKETGNRMSSFAEQKAELTEGHAQRAGCPAERLGH